MRAAQAPCKEGSVRGAQQAAGISWSHGEGHVSGGQRQTEVCVWRGGSSQPGRTETSSER